MRFYQLRYKGSPAPSTYGELRKCVTSERHGYENTGIFHLHSQKSSLFHVKHFSTKQSYIPASYASRLFKRARGARRHFASKGPFVRHASIGHIIRTLSPFPGVCYSYFCISHGFLSARVIFTVIFMCFPLSHFKNRFCYGLLPRKRGHFFEA